MTFTERMPVIYNFTRAQKEKIEAEMVEEMAEHLILKEVSILNAYEVIYERFKKYGMDPTISVAYSSYVSKKMSKRDGDPLMLFPRMFRLAMDKVQAQGYRGCTPRYLAEGYRAYARIREQKVAHSALLGISSRGLAVIDQIARHGIKRARLGGLVNEYKTHGLTYVRDKYLKQRGDSETTL